MRWLWAIAACAVLVASTAQAADLKTLEKLEAPAPVLVAPPPAGSTPNPIRLSKVVLQPREGESWALVISSGVNHTPNRLLEWQDGRMESDTSTFSRIFDEELRAAGFKGGGEGSLFDSEAATDLKVGVLIDDIKGRFCRDCEPLFQRDHVTAVVTMNARWEVYSTLQSRVLTRVTTSTGTARRKQSDGSAAIAVMFDAFRENVRVLINSEDFRRAVLAPVAPPKATLAPVSFAAAAPQKRTLASSTSAVVAIFAGDSLGTGFLISRDGYLLTNNHVVVGAKYVKVRWSDGAETIGEVLRTDPRRDIALIKADAGARQPLALRTAAATLGEAVYAVGTPLDAQFQGSVSKGIVSATRVYEGQPFIQSDVTVNHGNSGGPLLDETGAVIGVTTWGVQLGEAPAGVNFFIPIGDALKALALTPAG